MAKSNRRPIVRLTAQAWECPFCHAGNGVPEVSVCACGAVRVGPGEAEAPGGDLQPAAAAGQSEDADKPKE